jgi:cytochrome c556
MRAGSMRRTRRLLAFVVASAVVGTVSVGNAQAPPAGEADSLILDRQLLMTQLEDHSAALGDILAGVEPPDKLAETSRRIAKAARESAEAFETVAPGGHSKPEVWSNHPDFMKRMQEFATRAEAMAAAAETGNVAAVNELAAKALQCKVCHDLYREPKKG